MEAVTHEREPARFDRVARIYRALEYLSFGPMLERCRFAHLASLANCRRALVIGDGDGRFATRLLQKNLSVQVDAVDASAAMLRLLSARVTRNRAEARLATFCSDARSFTPPRCDYDLVVTHFFLDCLSSAETATLIRRISPHITPGTHWLVSEFQVPERGLIRTRLARTLISCLYAGFRTMTGLAVREIPPWRDLLAQMGFVSTASVSLLGGVLISELWIFTGTTSPDSVPSHPPIMTSEKDIDAASAPGTTPGIDPGPVPPPDPPEEPKPIPAPGPPPEPDPQPYPGPIPTPQPVTRKRYATLDEFTAGWRA